ncbi:MAG: aspartyl protease family protein [Phycisphaerae bacterium]
MDWVAPLAVVVMLLFPPREAPQNPWKEKVPAAVQEAERTRSVAAYRHALDVAWRADDWRASWKLASAALERYPKEPSLSGMIARALWRAGKMDEAERVVDTISDRTRDRVALTALIEIQLARGRHARASAAARRLEELGPSSAVEFYHVLGLRLAEDRLAGLAPLLRDAMQRVDPDNGYPEIYLEEVLDGLPEFFAAIGTEPINQIARHGSAAMPMIVVIRLPYCLATINGQGPYRLILDTGGSITLSLDDDIARELNLKSYGTATIRGISGKQDSEQTLVEELRIGEITCRRVMTRTFEFPDIMTLAGDGIIGTGIFARARMTLDFKRARLVVSPSSDEPAPGHATALRIVGDAKLIAPVKLQDEYAIAVLDSGADVAAVSPQRLKELFPDRPLTNIPTAGLGVGEGEATGITFAPGVKLETWGRTFENYSGMGLDALDTLLSPILGIQTQVLLGMPIFREMKSWTIDYPRRRMWVEWIED